MLRHGLSLTNSLGKKSKNELFIFIMKLICRTSWQGSIKLTKKNQNHHGFKFIHIRYFRMSLRRLDNDKLLSINKLKQLKKLQLPTY